MEQGNTDQLVTELVTVPRTPEEIERLAGLVRDAQIVVAADKTATPEMLNQITRVLMILHWVMGERIAAVDEFIESLKRLRTWPPVKCRRRGSAR